MRSREVLDRTGIEGEVIVVDNGSERRQRRARPRGGRDA